MSKEILLVVESVSHEKGVSRMFCLSYRVCLSGSD